MIYYFGCIGRIGHQLWKPPWHLAMASDVREGWPFHVYGWDLDGKYAPVGPQVQSLARIEYVKGWTVLAMWDRSVDERANSNSSFVARGNQSFEQMVLLAEQFFPEVWKRINTKAPVACADVKEET